METSSAKLFHITIAVTLLAITLLISFLLSTPSRPESYRLHSQNKTNTAPTPNALFTDQTHTYGIFSTHQQRAAYLSGLDESLGSGACAFDYNNDGWIDIYSVRGSGQNRFYGRPEWWKEKHSNSLYKNTNGTYFTDKTKESGLSLTSWGMGCASADLDNDGDQDLLLTNVGENKLYRNEGDGTFTDVTKASGISGNHWSTSAVIGDFNNDALLDIYVVNFIDYKKAARTYETKAGYIQQTPILFDPLLYNSQPNQLYQNMGSLHFRDITNSTVTHDQSGRGLSALWTDINGDGLPDIVTANGDDSPNRVFINNINGKFKESSEDLHLNISKRTAGLSSGDFDNDGDIDLIFSTDNNRPPLIYSKGVTRHLPISVTKSPFNEIGKTIGLGSEKLSPLSGLSISLQDFNNDGWLDIFSTNGFFTPDSTNPKKAQGQKKQIWLNTRGTYEPCQPRCSDALNDNLPGRGAVFADFDNDGDIDIYATHNNSLGQLLLNEQKNNNWLGIELIGTVSNRDGIGAKIRIETSKWPQLKELNGNPTFLSSGDKRIHFGLGTIKNVKNITITWPSGENQSYYNIPINNYIVIKEGENTFSIKTPETTGASNALPYPQFKDFSNKLKITESLAINNKKTRKFILEASRNKNNEIRKRSIYLAQKHKGPETLIATLNATKDPDPNIRALAIETLQFYEIEYTYRWILRSLMDKNTDVACAGAAAFEFFFHEEEAMTSSKRGAITKLIKLLKHHSPDVRECAANTLAESEDYRAAKPLALLFSDPDLKVKNAAIRAAGMIREKSLAQPIYNIAKDHSQHPTTISTALTALKRIEPKYLTEAYLNTLIPQPQKNKNIISLTSTLEAFVILTDQNTATPTIDYKLLGNTINHWLIKINNKNYANNEAAIAAAIKILSNTNFKNGKTILEKLSQSQSTNISLAAYSALLHLHPKLTNSLLSKAADTKNPAIIENAYNAALHNNSKPRLSIIKKGLNYKESTPYSITLLVRVKKPKAYQIISDFLSEEDIPTNRLLTIIRALNNHKTALTNSLIDKIYKKNRQQDVHIELIKNWSLGYNTNTTRQFPYAIEQGLKKQETVKQSTISLLNQLQPWALPLLSDLASNKNIDLDIRKKIVEKIATLKTKTSERIIFNLSKLKHDKISTHAIRELKHFSSYKNLQYLTNIFENSNNPEEVRAASVIAIFAINPEKAELLLTNQ